LFRKVESEEPDMVFVPPFAPFVALAFLGAGFLVLVGSATALFGLLSKRRALALGGGAVAATVAVAYAGLWLGASLLSRERVLHAGERKYFCEIDCHLAYSVETVEHIATLGAAGPRSRNGEFLVVTLKTWFDPSTVSPRRPLDAPLWPSPRNICLVDAEGKHYRRLPGATAALAQAGRASTPATEPLVPGQSYTTLLAFDVPLDARALKLYVGNISSDGAFLIGHEAAPLARKAWFAME
jgi:hypothetical protein